jgi:hypothetical protein
MVGLDRTAVTRRFGARVIGYVLSFTVVARKS